MITDQDDKFSALLRECCISIKKDYYAFHPKIILAEYIKNDNKIIHRLIISSRNLTRSELFETQVIVERKPTKMIKAFSGIKDMINYINDEQVKWEDKNIPVRLNPVSAKVHFQTPEDKETALFNKMKLKNESCKKIILSPFYSGLTSIESATYYTGDNLHSKLFCITEDGKSNLWIGSANCTKNGLNSNYECMVGLSFDSDISETLKKWLGDCGFSVVDTPTQITSTSELPPIEELLAKYAFKGTVENNKTNSDIYNLTFSVEPKTQENINFSNIEVSLITRNNFRKLTNEMKFENIPLNKVTNALVLKYENGNESIKRVVFAECTDDFKVKLSENTKQLSEQKLEDIIPDFTFALAVDESEVDDSNNKTSTNQKAILSFSPADEEYEMVCYHISRVDKRPKI